MFKLTPKEFREKVADALESGDYEQGVGALCRENKYCCLGVACETYISNGGHLNTSEIDGTKTYDKITNCLPTTVKNALGFNRHFGCYVDSSLAAENDRGVPFTEIAEHFRNPPKGLLAN